MKAQRVPEWGWLFVLTQMIFSTHRGVADAKQASGVRRKYLQTSAWQGKSFVYFQGISIRCVPTQSGIQNSQRPACASAFCRGIDAGGAPFEMNKKRLTEEQRIANKKASHKASRAKRKANGGPLRARIKLTAEQRAINQAAATRRWQERNRETILEKARIAGRKRWRENKDEEKIRAKIARAKRKDKTAIYNAEYRAAHKADYDAYMKEWKTKNKDALTARRKANYEANRDAFLTEKREYYIKNRDTIRAKKKTNREPSRRNEDIRRARKAGATVGDLRLIAEWEKRWRRKPLVRCYWCRSDIKPAGATRDHIVPLARGGEHSVSNLVVSCGSCNSKKHARPLDKWNATLEQPVLL